MAALGYLVPTREAVMEGRPATDPLLDLARRAESLGLDSLWVGDSLLARPRHDPLTLLGALAVATERATIGTAVLLPAYRNPVVMAQQIATIDQLAHGRLVIGVGIAGDVPNIRAEFTAAGVPFERRVGRMQEGLALCRALWSGEPVSWDGRWTVADATLGPTPFRTGGPPIWGAGSHPNAIRRVAKTMDGWMPIFPDTADGWSGLKDDLAGELEANGRSLEDITTSLYVTVYVDDDETAANARIDRFLESYYGIPGKAMRRAQACFGGSREALTAWLRSFVEAGVDHLIVRLAGDHEAQLDCLSEIRHDVIT